METSGALFTSWGSGAVLGAVIIYGISKIIAADPSLTHIPFLKFEDGDNATERYIKDTKALLHRGYLMYTKKGIAFRMRNPVDPDHPQVILPWKYMEEVRHAPQSQFSFALFSKQAFLLDYINAPQQTDAAVHLVRGDINKHLGTLVPGTQEECESELRARLPKGPEWTSFSPYMALAYTVSRATARVLVGRELCENDEWVEMGVQTTLLSLQAAQEVRKSYPRGWRWLARWRHPGAKAVLKNRRRAAELLAPVVEKQRRPGSSGSSSASLLRGEEAGNGIQWSLSANNGVVGRLKTPQEVADEQLFLGVAGIHSSSATSLSILYDLLDRPDAMGEIVEEIQAARNELKDGVWTRLMLARLAKLDSFMAESQRFNSIGLVSVQRSTVDSFQFSDGLRIPKNTQFSFLNNDLNYDPDVYPDPETFDPWRFLKLREKGDPNKFHFTFVSDQSIRFGAGSHSCPGRFYASVEIKLVLISILTHWDIRWPKGQSRPPNAAHDFHNGPDPTAIILFREKGAD